MAPLMRICAFTRLHPPRRTGGEKLGFTPLNLSPWTIRDLNPIIASNKLLQRFSHIFAHIPEKSLQQTYQQRLIG